MGLCVAAGALAIEQQHLACLLGDGAAEVLLDEMRGERRRTRSTCTGDPRAIRKKQAIRDDVVTGKGFAKILVVIPTHTGPPTFHEARAAQDEAAGTDTDQRHMTGADLAQVTNRGLIDLWAGMQDAADD